MKKEIQEAWGKFFGKGWEVNQVPDKRECFEAGYTAAIEMIKSQIHQTVVNEKEAVE
jgi:hypothetical protein